MPVSQQSEVTEVGSLHGGEETLDVRDARPSDESAVGRALGLQAALALALGDESRRTLIDRFEVQAKLGQGGMGVVYRAYDPELDRTVALKFLHARGGERERERMLKEARALARLSDPHVVTIYEVGVWEGRVYFAMEYVEGGNLRQWIAARPDCDWRTVLDLFLRAGRGLEAAHAAGIVHRDFKPENVLVGRDGRVRVGDFGLAMVAERISGPTRDLALDRTNATTVDQTHVAGTPAYMPLEQVMGGAVGPRSDQYSFCKSLRECLDRVAEGPAASRPRWPRRLDRILARGLADEAAARFPDMGALLDALERFRDRGRTTLVSASVVLGLSALAVAGRAGLSVPAADSGAQCRDGSGALVALLDEAQVASLEVHFERLPRGSATLSAVMPALRDYARRWGEARGEACEASWPADGGGGAQSVAALELRLACLEGRRAHFERLLAALGEADETMVEAAPRAVAGLPRLEPCARPEQLARIAPGPGVSPAAAREVSELETALTLAEADLSLDRDPEIVDRLATLVARAEATGHAPLIARVLLAQASAQGAAGGGQTRAINERAFVMAQRGFDDASAFEAALNLAHEDFAGRNDLDGARFWNETAAALAERLELGPRERARVGTSQGYAALYGMEVEEAVAAFEAALELLDGDTPLRDRAVIRSALGNALDYAGRFDESVAVQRQAVEELSAVAGPENGTVLAMRGNYATTLLGGGRLDEARDEYLALLEIYDRRPDRGGLNTVSVRLNLGEVERRAHRYAEAEGYVRGVISLIGDMEGQERHLITAHHNLAAILELRGDYEQALSSARAAVALVRRVNGDREPQLVAQAQVNEAVMLYRLGRAEEARAVLDEAIASVEGTLGPQHLALAPMLEARAQVELLAGHAAAARADAARGLAVLDAAEGDDPEFRGRLQLALGEAHIAAGRATDAKAALTAARAALADDDLLDARARCLLAGLIWEEGERDEALEAAREARESLALGHTPHVRGWFDACDSWLKSRD